MIKGVFIDDSVRKRIVVLLKHTELTMVEIGKRFGMSAQTIEVVNKEFKVRTYQGRSFTVNA